MGEVLQFAIIGLGPGAIIGLLAVGLVMIFRGAGVVNLSHGACAMFSGYVYAHLRGSDLPVAASLILAVVIAALIGLATDQLLLRRLRNSSALTRLIATMGVLLLLQSVSAKIWGVVPKTVESILPSSAIHLGGVSFSSDRLWLLLIAIVVTTIIAVVWRFTRLGWIAEGASENQRLASTLGWSPELVSGMTWTIGAGLAGLAGILIAPISQLDTRTLPLLVVPALAAALIGGFRSFPITLIGAVGIGIAQSETAQFVNVPGAPDALPFLVIVIGLMVKGSALPLRGHSSDRLPRVGSGRVRWIPLLIVSAGVIALLTAVNSLDWLAALTSTIAVATILLSFIVLIGYTGQVSLAQYAIAGFGALIAAQLSKAGTPFVLALLIGAVGAAIVGLVFAVPALRTRGVNLAIVTLGLAVAAYSLIFTSTSFAGGVGGILVESPTILGFSIDPVLYPQRYAVFAFVMFVLLALGVARLRRSSVGRMLLAIRDNEQAAASNGVNILGGKLVGFGIAGAIAGVGGIVLSFQSQAIAFGGYDPLSSISMMAYSVLGGVGYLFGPLFGATLSPGSLGAIISLNYPETTSWLPIIGAVALLLTILISPHGWVHDALKPFSAVARWWDFHVSVGLAKLGRTDRDTGVKVNATDATSDTSRPLPKGLSVGDITVRYGGNIAVNAVGLAVSPGKIVGLIGPNGAGKTSFMDAVTGFTRIGGGTIRMSDVDLTRWPAYKRARAGLVRSFQSLELYPDLTVRENVLTAADRHDARGLIKNVISACGSRLDDHMQEVLDDFGLVGSLDLLPEEISYGQRRLLAIARAVAARPSVLLLDEPVAGLDDAESAEFAVVLQKLARDRGISILVIEHDMNFVMGICDQIVVMDFGTKIAEGAAEEVLNNKAAIAAYLGDEATEADETAIFESSS
ncbi:amino acid/amide ABC transporter membrane protein 1 (HAAT family) /amino acid/amide ABC transporter membrane protein 2 (HAAT family) /amino acid/amide ABC transporter ATP-binding protein 1 (HAAT family) [Arthrobacter sp. SLBN-100]|uniref:branched-chain amino acid ABC transporter permease/ATP-binding protein n=1 Tax=Arthrobacter sp. SLBN-100 TaxID=2768450 RepID=UPI00114DA942|nr:branched-chain amino acid ABC transporter permease/ATP-binding protein [Arthrobacter sp. SLBN-100]TQJ62172.1 amino acid/amide ABC transporter membrane protein 1 (HAAT family) /amino acid/amide ABC transporter membrane protein 2 (HAAT family) /amino acid/amide ABC transporter ATP-binding protein 1 (HAAT family) [Arthrobacter sp. SLBN-100]